MSTDKRNTAVLWTGGKDCALAHSEAVQAGQHVTRLVTFAPVEPEFRAHPIPVMRAQAEALGLPHTLMTIVEPYAESYGAAIRSLRDDFNISTLVTGDIDRVDGQPNWITERAAGTGVDVFTPLWNYNREDLLHRLIGSGFVVVFSCVKRPWLGSEWLGRQITPDSLAELRALSASTGLDLCGENGEYHTLVLDGPLFHHPLHLDWTAEHTEEMSWMRMRDARFASTSQ